LLVCKSLDNVHDGPPYHSDVLASMQRTTRSNCRAHSTQRILYHILL
jgi:hypothetical protein